MATITGTAGDDTLLGTAAQDTIYGGDDAILDNGATGNDSVDGGAERDFLFGEDGNDTLNGGSGSFDDVLAGGSGDDSLVGGGNNNAFGGDRADYSSATDGVVVNLGATAITNGVDVLAERSAIDGLGGTDVLSGIEFVSGSQHDDLFVGTNTGDTVNGNNGNDNFYGGPGDDTILGGTGSDFADYMDFYGFTGPGGVGVTVDLSQGTATDQFGGQDVLDSINSVRGTNYDDSLKGGDPENDGASSLISNFEFLNGRGGNDTLEGVREPQDFGGNITTFANYQHAPNDTVDGIAAHVTLATGFDSMGNTLGTANDGEGGTDVLVDIIGAQGSAFADSLVGGADTQFGATQNFTQGMRFDFLGHAGNDTIDGTHGDDRAIYTYLRTGGPGVSVDLGLGTATVGADTLTGSPGETDTLIAVERARGSNNADTLVGSDVTSHSEFFEGGPGNDSIDGKLGFDIAQYSADTMGVSVDLLAGTATGVNLGTDTLSGIEGVIGSRGNDSVVGGTAIGATALGGSSGYFEMGRGADTVVGNGTFDEMSYNGDPGPVSVNLGTGTATDGWGFTDTFSGIDAVRGSRYDDTITGSVNAAGTTESFRGMEGDDLINAAGGQDRIDYSRDPGGVTVVLSVGYAVDGWGDTDTLIGFEQVRGSNFNDNIVGNFANNRIVGLDGNDRIIGEDGNDTLEGGGGNDTMEGGDGNDSAIGGAGDDKYYVSSMFDKTVEALNEGIDTVEASSSWVLGLNIENLVLGAGFGPVNGTGNVLANVITGNEQANLLSGVGGNDTLRGGGGNDTLAGGNGLDLLDGGAGNDAADYSTANVAVNASMKTGMTTGAGGADTLVSIEMLIGTAFNDTLAGGNAVNAFSRGVQITREILRGGAGADSLIGSGGDIFVDASYSDAQRGVVVSTVTGTLDDGYGAGSADTFQDITGIVGSQFGDQLTGGGSAWKYNDNGSSPSFSFETFEGLGGNDTIDGSVGTDRAAYFNSPSAVSVNLGTGTASDGWGGTDTLIAIERADGSSFNDTLTGSNATTFTEFLVGRAGADILDGLGGFDIAYYDTGNQAAVVDLGAGMASNDGHGSSDTLANIEGLRGSYFNDSLTGSNTAVWVEFFEPIAGFDMIDGAGGLDEVTYHNAPGRVVVDLAADMVFADGYGYSDSIANIEWVRGSYHDDEIYGSDDLSVVETFRGMKGEDEIDGRGGLDAADYSFDPNAVLVDLGAGGAMDGWGTFDGLQNIEYVNGSGFDDRIAGDGNGNFLDGRNGSDVLSGAAGDDTLQGGSGNDRLDGGTGNDVMTGGFGDDLYVVDNASDAVTESSGQGIDTVQSSTTYTLGAEVEHLRVTGALDRAGFGNSLDNKIQGSVANNLLRGIGGNDTLLGGAGNDTLDGGNGLDYLVGGSGADVFVFANPVSAAQRDVLRDFVSGVDAMQLDATFFTAVGGVGALGAGLFNSGIGMTAAADADDRIVYDTASGKLYYDADGAGGAAAAQFAVLTGAPALVGTDFSVVP